MPCATAITRKRNNRCRKRQICTIVGGRRRRSKSRGIVGVGDKKNGNASPSPFRVRVILSQYVDLEYEDGGIGEYQYWDRSTNQWNDTACQYAENGSGGSQDENDDGESNYS